MLLTICWQGDSSLVLTLHTFPLYELCGCFTASVSPLQNLACCLLNAVCAYCDVRNAAMLWEMLLGSRPLHLYASSRVTKLHKKART